MDKFKTFAVTIRPRCGVTDKHIETFTKYFCKGRTEYSYVVTEKCDGERHLHAALLLKKVSSLSNFCTTVIRLYKDLDPEERSNLRKSIKVWYSNDFIDYIKKGDNTVVIHSNLPEKQSLESYYPPKPILKGKKTYLYMHDVMGKYETLWRTYVAPHVEVNTSNVRDFLFRMQYEEREIGLLTDTQMFQRSKWFTRWMMKADICRLELPPFEKEEGPGLH